MKIPRTWPEKGLGLAVRAICPDCFARLSKGPAVRLLDGQPTQMNLGCERCGSAFDVSYISVGETAFARRIRVRKLISSGT